LVVLRTHEGAARFKQIFSGLQLPANKSNKICQVSWARVQGCQANIQHYRNTPIAEEFKPVIFDSDGQRLPFPGPDPLLFPYYQSLQHVPVIPQPQHSPVKSQPAPSKLADPSRKVSSRDNFSKFNLRIFEVLKNFVLIFQFCFRFLSVGSRVRLHRKFFASTSLLTA
jgi:hypothetical protein